MSQEMIRNLSLEAYNCGVNNVVNENLFVNAFLDAIELAGFSKASLGSYVKKDESGYVWGVVFDKNNLAVFRVNLAYHYASVTFNSYDRLLDKEKIVKSMKEFFKTEEVFVPIDVSLGKHVSGDIFEQVRKINLKEDYASDQIEYLFLNKKIICAKYSIWAKSISPEVFVDKRYFHQFYGFMISKGVFPSGQVTNEERSVGAWGDSFVSFYAGEGVSSFCFLPKDKEDVYLSLISFSPLNSEDIKQSVFEFFVCQEVVVETDVEWGLGN